MKKQILGILLFIITLSPLFSIDKGYFVVVYKKSDIIASIDVNGYLISKAGKDGYASGQMEANLWLMPGENKIKIKFIKPFTKGNNPSEPECSVKIYLGQAGQMPSDGKEILNFIAKESAEEKITFPSEKEISFTPDFLPPSELWKKAEAVVELNDSDKKEISEIVNKLNSALDTGNSKELFALTEFRDADTAKARFFTPAELRPTDAQLKGMFKMTAKKMKPVPTKLSFEVIAGNKIVNVTDSKGNNPIMGKPSKTDGQIEVPIYVSKIDGKWTLVR